MDYKQIGQRIRNERKKFNLSREKFAEILNLSTNFVGQIERGEKSPSLDTFVSIGHTLHLSLDYMVSGETETTALQRYLSRCTEEEIEYIADVVRAMLPHLKKREKRTKQKD